MEFDLGKLFEKKIEIIAAYLYGSFLYAENPNDIDIGLLIKENFQPDHLYEIKLARELEKMLKTRYNNFKPIDVRILNHKSLRFLFSIFNNSKVIYSKNDLERCNFEDKIIKQYFDIKPHYDFYDKMRYVRYANE